MVQERRERGTARRLSHRLADYRALPRQTTSAFRSRSSRVARAAAGQAGRTALALFAHSL